MNLKQKLANETNDILNRAEVKAVKDSQKAKLTKDETKAMMERLFKQD